MAPNHFLIRYRRTIAQAALFVYVLNPLLVTAQVIVNAGTANDGRRTLLLAAGNATLQSAGAMNLLATEQKTATTTSYATSDVNAGGNLTLQSTNDLTVQASKLSAGQDLKVESTGGSVNLQAVTNTQDTVVNTTQERKVFGMTLKTSQSTSIHQEDVQGVELTSGGNTQVKALGDLTAESLQLRAGGDAALGAAGAVAITSGQAYSSTQTGSDVRQSLQTDRSVIDAVGKVIIYGQQALQLSATTVDAGGKALVQSQGDIELGYNTDTEQHNWTTSSTDRSWYGKKTTTTTQHETVDKAAEVTKINASEVQVLGNNITSLGADITGQNLVQVEGVGKTALYAVNEEHLTKADSKSSSSWIGITYSKSSSSDSNLNTTALGTQLTSEEAIKLGVGTVTDVRGVIMTAPKIDIVRSEGADTSKDGELILGVSTNTTESSHTEKTTTLGLWQAQSGQGSTTQTANQTVINGKLNIGEGINTTVQIPEGNLKDQIAALSQQPGLGYLKDLASNPNIKWEQVKLAHDEWSYSQQGLTPAGAALLSIAVAVASGGAAAGFVNSLGFTGATAAGMTAGMTAMASSAAVSFVNNGGDIGKTLKDLGSKDSVKNIALAMVTAGVLSELGSSYQIDGKNLNDIKVADGFQANLGKAVINNLANAGVTSALTGTSLEDNIKTGLVSAFISAGAGSAAFEIGNQTQDSQVLKALAHALAGCMAGGAAGGKQGCESGAIGAVVGELAAQWYDPNGTKPPKDTLDFVKVISAAAGAITGDGSAASVSTAVMTGVNAAQNNYLNHTQWKQLADKLKTCATEAECNQVRKEFVELSAKQDAAMREACKDLSSPACRTKIAEAQVGSMTQKDLLIKGVLPESYWSTANDLNAVANGFAKQAFLSDLKTECARNPSCDAKKTAALTKLGSTVLDFTPVIGDIKAFVEAETPFDYLLATLGVTGPLGDSVAKALREGRALYKAGDIAGASAKLDEAKNIKDVNLANLVSPTNSGYLNKTKLGSAEMVVNTPTASQRLTISDVMANGDKYGTKTEALVNDVLKSDPSIKVLDGTKYGSNNGLDHVVQYVDPQTGKTMTMVIDSKQLAINGTTNLDPKAAGGVMQLSDESLRTVVGRLDGTPAGKAVEGALDSGTLVKAVAYVDKRTGELKIVPLAVSKKS